MTVDNYIKTQLLNEPKKLQKWHTIKLDNSTFSTQTGKTSSHDNKSLNNNTMMHSSHNAEYTMIQKLPVCDVHYLFF